MSVKALFNPKSVAVVGASAARGKVGNEVLRSLIRGGFKGAVYPINSKGGVMEGLACYRDLASIGEVPDLVVIVVPAKAVPDVMRQCAALKVRSVVVISAGFRESGPAGEALEREVVQIARRAGIRMVGPNCVGLMSTHNGLNASFGGELPARGSIGYFSQSGSLLSAIVDMANADRVGFSKLISIGNKADVNELDVLRAFAADDDTKVIAGYLETIADGDAFMREAEVVSRRKPILLMKSGETGSGAEAASSHTGSLVSRQAAFESLFARAGIVRCQSIKAQFDYACALASQPLPLGKRVAVIANAGGAGIMAVDAIEREGLELAPLAEPTRSLLAANLPPSANVNNPVDVLGDALADRYELAVRAVMADPNVDAVLALLTPHAMTECMPTARVVVEAAARAGKPVLACFLGAHRMAEAVGVLRDGGVPRYDCPEAAVATIAAMVHYAEFRKRPKRVVRLFPVNRRKVETHHRPPPGPQRPGYRRDGGQGDPRGLRVCHATRVGRHLGRPGGQHRPADRLPRRAEDLVARHPAQDRRRRRPPGAQQRAGGHGRLRPDDVPHPPKRPDANILGVLVQQMVSDQRQGSDPRDAPRPAFRAADDVRHGRDHGRGPQGRGVLPGPLTADEAKQMLLSTQDLPVAHRRRGREGRGCRRHRRGPPAAQPVGDRVPRDQGDGHQPVRGRAPRARPRSPWMPASVWK
jgi:acetyl coenzyme A synthetase (ADP forming)-like protein